QGITSVDINNLLTNAVNIGITTNLSKGGTGAFDQNYAGGGSVYYDASSGITLLIYHGEYWYNPPSGSPFYAGLGLAYSRDKGVTWTKLGQVISPQTTRSGNCQVDTGPGTLVPVNVGGVLYFYIWYVDESTGCNTGNFNLAVARATASSVIAAAQAGTPFTFGPGSLFQKYSSGSFSQNGVNDLANPQNGGGSFDALLTGNTTWVPNVAFNSYLNEFVLTYASGWNGIGMRFSGDGIHWGSENLIVPNAGSHVPPNATFYPTSLNTNGGDPETLGQSFYVYYVEPFGDWSTSNLKRVSITIGAPSSKLFVSQAGAGTQDGTSCANAKPMSFFGNSSNWGVSAPIGPGTTVAMCGTITSQVIFQGGGTSGNPITLQAQSGAVLTQAASIVVNFNGQSNIVLDGNGTGTIQETANGRLLANQNNVQLIYASGSCNVEVKGWTLPNEYIAVPPTAAPGIDDTLNAAYYANGYCGKIFIHNNTIHDTGWAINVGSPATGSSVTIDSNDVYNVDHCFVANAGPNRADVIISNNHCHDTANWDTTTNSYHHDGWHVYGTQNAASTFMAYGNKFDGDWGENNTAHIFGEDDPPNVTIFNNIDLQKPGNLLHDGFYDLGGTGIRLFDNTLVCDPTLMSME